MSTQTNIQWTHVTDNIIVVKGGGWWCRMITEECINCYAATLNQSDYFGGNHLPYTGKPPELILREDIIEGWARQRNPKLHFVASMTDIFGDWVPRDWVFKFLDGMRAAPRQVFQLLTKRSDIARIMTDAWLISRGLHRLPNNIAIGASAGNRKRLAERIGHLQQTKAAIRFLSMEPLLQETRLVGFVNAPSLDWVIVGGESGPKARPCNVGWIDRIVRDCNLLRIPCFVKQLGKVCVTDNANLHDWPDEIEFRGEGEGFAAGRALLKDPKGGNWEEWPDQLRVRQFPPQWESLAA